MTTAKRCVIYCRISLDRSGKEAGVERQEAECRLLAASLGFEVIVVYVDNDISAFSGRRRPEFERLLEDAPAAIIVWHIDRLVILSRDLERVLALKVNVHSVMSGHLDLSNPAGRAVAKTVTAWAQYERELKGERQRAANRQRKAAGTTWWTVRPFGYDNRGKLMANEATALRAVYRAAAAGELNLARHARALNAQGFATTLRARPLSSGTLREILLSERNLGGPGVEPLIDEDTWMTVRDALRGRPGRGGQSPVGLLCGRDGVARCGVCGGYLVTGNAPKSVKSYRKTYMCAPENGAHMVWPKDAVDEIVAREVAAVLRDNMVKIQAEAGTETADETAELQRLALDFAAKRLTADEFTAAVEREHERVARRASKPRVLKDWDDLTHDQRRAALAVLIERIDLPPRGRGSGRNGVPENVVIDAIVWR